MNLLNYKNRFTPFTSNRETVCEIHGYTMAMNDFLTYLQELTEFNPEKRLVDSVKLLEAITDTNSKLMELYQKEEKQLKTEANDLAGVNLGSPKVTDFLREQLNWSEEIPDGIYLAPVKSKPDDLLSELRHSEIF